MVKRVLNAIATRVRGARIGNVSSHYTIGPSIRAPGDTVGILKEAAAVWGGREGAIDSGWDGAVDGRRPQRRARALYVYLHIEQSVRWKQAQRCSALGRYIIPLRNRGDVTCSSFEVAVQTNHCPDTRQRGPQKTTGICAESEVRGAYP